MTRVKDLHGFVDNGHKGRESRYTNPPQIIYIVWMDSIQEKYTHLCDNYTVLCNQTSIEGEQISKFSGNFVHEANRDETWPTTFRNS